MIKEWTFFNKREFTLFDEFDNIPVHASASVEKNPSFEKKKTVPIHDNKTTGRLSRVEETAK